MWLSEILQTIQVSRYFSLLAVHKQDHIFAQFYMPRKEMIRLNVFYSITTLTPKKRIFIDTSDGYHESALLI